MSTIDCPIPKCNREKAPDHYACRKHWFMLPDLTRTNLWKKDRWATTRYQLFVKAAVIKYWPLESILIATDPKTGRPRLWKFTEAPLEVFANENH